MLDEDYSIKKDEDLPANMIVAMMQPSEGHTYRKMISVRVTMILSRNLLVGYRERKKDKDCKLNKKKQEPKKMKTGASRPGA